MHDALVGLLAVCAGALALHGAESSGSARRRETLELATRLLAQRASPTTQLPAELVNPFNPQAKAGKNADGSKPERPAGRSDLEILQKIASSITPSGMMILGDRPRLVFRERKYEVGESIKRAFEGVDYVVVITAIDATSFRIRLNREEITRPIKPAKIP
jgi:hypothetical protein